MKRRLVTVTVVVAFFCGLLCLSRVACAVPYPHYRLSDALNQHRESGSRLSTFTGTIAKNGDRFVLNHASSHFLYELDDQETAGKFREKKVKVTGTLDVVKNLIRLQSIAEDAA